VDAWVSAQHRWTLFTIDFSICLDNGLANVGLFEASDPVWQRILATPKFRRMYCRALNELVNGVMQASVINPVLDAKYAAFVAAGLTPLAPTSTKFSIASQRSTIISQLAAVNATTFAVSTNTFVASSNSATLTGSAPVEVVSISIHGVNFSPVWTTVTNWSVTVPAPAGTNTWAVVAYDRYGNTVEGTLLATVENPSVPESPVGNVVFNEIMFNAPVPEAEYVELFNRSPNTTFDVSGWVVNGLDYTFPPGSTLPPQKYLVLAKSSVVFASTYGALVPVFGTFNGGLQSDGETLSLIQPGAAPTPDVVIDRVRYEPSAPWPAAPAMRPGTSLQLIDPGQDNSRVANWTAGQTNQPTTALRTPGTDNSVRATLSEFPPLWLNEVQAENLTGPSDNSNEHDPWVELYNSGTATVSLDGLYLGTNYANPAQWAFPADSSIAPGQFLVVWLDGQPAQTSGAILHTSFRLSPGSGSVALSRFVASAPQIVDYLNYAALPANYSYGDVPDGQPFYRQAMFRTTPAETNNAALPPLTVSINEWMAENTGGLLNPGTGKYDDWFELHNPADTPAELAGYYLTDTLTNAFQYPARGFLLVWADGKPSANSTNSTDLHVPFKLAKDGEAIGLFTPDGAAIDAVAFGEQTSNVSEGRYPDAAGLRLFMPVPSPRSPNILPPASGPPVVTGIAMQTDHSCVLTFESAPGHTYRIEFKNDLGAPSWQPLGADEIATDTSLTIIDNSDGPQRFYRVVLVE
jgi:hypothetical protein